MVARGFAYRSRFLIVALLFVIAYPFYGLDRLNIVYAVLPESFGALSQDALARIGYALAALVGIMGAVLMTWASAYRNSDLRAPNPLSLRVAGPYCYVRYPHYLGLFLLVLSLGSFQSRLGFWLFAASETVFFVRVIAHEERQLRAEFGDRFGQYCSRVPALVPSFRPRIAPDGAPAQWRRAFKEHAFAWALVATLIIFAFTLNDPAGYLFGSLAIFVFLFQKVMQSAHKVRQKTTNRDP